MLSIDMQFMLDEEKLPFLTWHPSGLTPWQIWWSISVCETGSWMPCFLLWSCLVNTRHSALFPVLVLFGEHILSFYKWKIVQQLKKVIIPMWLVCLMANQHATFTWKDTISVFSVSQGSVEALIRWGGKI